MTQRVEPSPGTAESNPLSGAIKHAFGRGFIAQSYQDFYAGDHPDISGAPLNAFDATHSTSSLDVEIDTGEAFVEGKWLAKDTATSVSLDANSTTTVYVLWPADSGNDIRITYEGSTEYPSGANGRLALWTFETDGTGVTSATDERILGERMSVDADGSIRVHDTLETNDNAVIGTDLSVGSDATITGSLAGLSTNDLTDLEGSALSVDSSGVLNADTGSSVSALSDLTIDVTKDWQGYGITGLGGPLESNTLGNGDEFIYVEGGNNDPLIWRAGNSRDYGFQMQYTGSGSGNDNSLDLFTDDGNNAGRNQVWEITQDGDIDFKNNVTQNGSSIGGSGASSLSELDIDTSKDWKGYNIQNAGVLSASEVYSGGDPVLEDDTGTGYKVQKNGTDGTGIINFKT